MLETSLPPAHAGGSLQTLILLLRFHGLQGLALVVVELAVQEEDVIALQVDGAELALELVVGVGAEAAAQEAARHGLKVGFILQRDPNVDEVSAPDLYRTGTSGQLVRVAGASDGAQQLMVQGERRFRVLEFLEGWPFLVASVAWIPEAGASSPEIEARFLQLKEQAAEAIRLLPNLPDELAALVPQVESPSQLADMVANLLDIKNEEKQEILETFNLARRLDLVLRHLAERVEVLRLSKEIGDKTKKEFDERQREHVLREQMRQIQKELGDEEDTAAELEELSKAIEAAGLS